ncbi:peptidase domain-containing ABC transporter [Endozoicomonas sp. ALB091]|uniref:peptidase domain-containing ABC transporter n=1 Tax=Endozoicomonas sp. ALB091 TaxID=3403073 RepID=UPI003BB587E0
MVTSYFGHEIDLNTLRNRFSVSLRGSTLEQLMNISEQLLMNSRALQLDLDEIKELRRPCILHWNLNHFVVLKSVSRKGILIHDPSSGVRHVNWEDTSKSFTGIALELQPSPSFKRKKETKKMGLSSLWTNISGLKRSLVQIFFLALALEVFALVTPYFMQLTIDNVVVNNDRDLIFVLGLGFLLLTVFNVATSAIRSWVILFLRSHLGIQLASNLFRHLLRLPLPWFEKRHMGDVVSRFSSLSQVNQMLSTGFIEGLTDGLMAVVTLAMMYIYSPKLATVALGAVLLYTLFRLAFFRPLKTRTEESIMMAAKEDSDFMESVRAIQPLKLFNREAVRISKWQNSYADWVNADIRVGRLQIAWNTFHRLSSGVEYIVLIWLGALLILDNIFSIGMLYAFLAWRQQFSGKAQTFIDKLFEYQMLTLHLDRIADIALTEDEEHLDTPHTTLTKANGEISLRDVCFKYNDEEPWLLENINLDIQPGESVVIVAPSGFGKTTLMKIMMGLIQPCKGQVLLDGKDIRHLGLRNYRRQASAVMQDDQLLSGSIADNIAFFAAQHDQARIEECAAKVGILPEIMAMPMGMQTLVGDMGNTLSGGQIQRLLLARALYADPAILFLDEATSHLDTISEQQVNKVLKNLGISRIMIAHRQETIAMADRVIDLAEMQLARLHTVRAVEEVSAKIKATGFENTNNSTS